MEKTAAQIHAESERTKSLIKNIAESMQLRKWCVEKAVEVAKHGATGEGIKLLTEFFYDFVTKA